VSFPDPIPGLVIRYSYLWRREADQGQEEGRKDRPCAIILTTQNDAGLTRVIVLPVTHSPPVAGQTAIELPHATKQRLGLDDARSWVVITEANDFIWPGPDLRPIGKDQSTVAYGFLPPSLYRTIRDSFVSEARRSRKVLVSRTD
jgi:hypothetical protein